MADQNAGPMGVEELDELERLFNEWFQSRDPEAPWPLGVLPHWTSFDKLRISLLNATPRLLALARSAITAEAAGREKGLEEFAQYAVQRANRYEAEGKKAQAAGENSRALAASSASITWQAAADIARLTAASAPPALAQPSATRKEE